MDRRDFIKSVPLGALGGISGCAATADQTSGAQVENASVEAASFLHGVASGDPLSDRIILWTRVTPPGRDPEPILVDWWIGPSDDPSSAVHTGRVLAQGDRDFTVKVDAQGLQPGRTYYYGFQAGEQDSPIGRTRTLPLVDVNAVRLAVTSCANHPQGYFNAYRAIAETEELDVVLSLGDYLYEYANEAYGDGSALDRVPEPNREIVSLADYRMRHAQYKRDPDLQAAHAAHPWIVVWDDHESTNNAWTGGAQNHNPETGEGTWWARRNHAIKAYYEWMPIRSVPTGLFRTFRFGQLADLVMLDTRLEGRDEQGAGDDFETANRADRTLLGPAQEHRFLNHLTVTQQAAVRWKLVGQQVAFAPWSDADAPFNADSWSGYRQSRRNVLSHIADHAIDNVVILSGDVHSSWGLEVPDDARQHNRAIELITPAVSSPPLTSRSKAMEDLMAQAISDQAHIKFADGQHNGYLVVTLRADSARADWFFTGERTLKSDPWLGQSMGCNAGTNRLSELAR